MIIEINIRTQSYQKTPSKLYPDDDISIGFGGNTPKPIGHIIPPNVWRVPAHSPGLSPLHRLPYQRLPLDTGVWENRKVSGETASENGLRKVP